MRHPFRIALIAVVALAACSPRPAAHREEPARAVGGEPGNPAPGVVDVATARRLVAEGARVVDVRTPSEYAQGHVPGAVNVPFDELARRAAEVGPPGEPVVLYCRSGRRSAIAAETLRGLGYGKVYDLQRYDLWRASDGSAGK